MELGEALRNTENLSKELTPLSSVACGATSFLWKEAINCGKAATFPLSASEHNPSTQPAAVRRPQPAPSGVSLFNLPRSGDTITLRSKAGQT